MVTTQALTLYPVVDFPLLWPSCCAAMISYFSSAVDVRDATDGESVAAAVCLGVGIAVADEATDALKSWCRKRRFPTLLVSVATK